MKRLSLFPMIFLFATMGVLSQAESIEKTENIAVVASDGKNGHTTIQKIEEEHFDESFILASSQISDIFNAASEAASSELPEAFQLSEIEVGLGVTASAGALFWSVAAEGGVVLHFTKRE
ncbi:MAG: hypothetical protein A2X86_08245 [Bdellovibrionales bacterium GWA2_49_15]|nr:MAG: hypothetical protein A2X86_08245 [Bdellovibrionales bacterium GWA2_49_15]HAZ11249.1 hypothetical protein [Bdellovibrionales bacterium]